MRLCFVGTGTICRIVTAFEERTASFVRHLATGSKFTALFFCSKGSVKGVSPGYAPV